ncbi:hypothetical protein ACP70R_028797 [Stipagrostis hirtigluma subsp. patula]
MKQLNCISLLIWLSILLAALSPIAATARRELLMAAVGDERHDQAARALNTMGDDAPKAAAKGAEEVTRRRTDERMNCRFRTRKTPSQVHFSGRMPFTADYHNVRRHPPKHN